MKIRYLHREDIDKTKWNSCVHYANTGSVGGYMWYLDQVTKEWDALVEGDYESVMPLIWRTGRFGGKELYQPNLIPNAGIYSIYVLSPKRVKAFLDLLPEHFRNIRMHLNEKTDLSGDNDYAISKFTNYHLPLNKPLEVLYEGFSESLKTKIHVAEERGLLPVSDLKPERLAEFYQKHTKRRKGLSADFHALQRIMWNALHRGWGFASGVLDEDKELLAIDFFIYSHGKVQSLMPTASPKGRKAGALEYLSYMMLRKNADSPLLFDFNTKSESKLALEMGAKPKLLSEISTKRKWSLFG